MPLQDMPQTLSPMQVWQMAKPHRQVQQNGAGSPQQWQVRSRVLRLRARNSKRRWSFEESFFSDESVILISPVYTGFLYNSRFDRRF
jgi:hypothetical protein